MMTELYVAEEHSALYDLWLSKGEKNISLCHIDFHCDMRGLLIDRVKKRTRSVWKLDPYMKENDSGSFLTHAIMNGFVSKLRWIHDDIGGRKFDSLYCVKYEDDISSLPFMIPFYKHWIPLEFEEMNLGSWRGTTEDEYLSIDWDAFAFKTYELSKIRQITAQFMELKYRPKAIFVCYSAEYVYPDRNLFLEFVAGLEEKFQTSAIYLPNVLHAPKKIAFWWLVYHLVENRILRFMRKLDIY